jgi:spermidine synthase
MKPRILLAESSTPDGAAMSLFEHDGAYSISFKGQELMHSKASTSELLLGKLGVEQIDREPKVRVMIGGLGLGFTLRTVLGGLGGDAQVDVVELVPKVVEWNREFLRGLNGELLDDPRVNLIEGDAVNLILKGNPNTYHAVILDVDNGPTGMVKASNDRLYSHSGLRAVRSLLRPGGRTAFWSAGDDPHFKARLEKVGFRVGRIPAKVHERSKRAAYVIYLADR